VFSYLHLAVRHIQSYQKRKRLASPRAPSYSYFNRREAERLRHVPLAQLRVDLDSTYRDLIALLPALSDEDLRKVFPAQWWNSKYHTTLRGLLREEASHLRIHAGDIRKWRKGSRVSRGISHQVGAGEKSKMNAASRPTRELYRHLRSETSQVFFRWKVFQQLFSSPEVVELLKKLAPRLFFTLRSDLLDAIALSLSRLTDPSETRRGERNASLQQLINSPDVKTDAMLVQELNHHLYEMRDECKRIDIWRNKWTAHRDYQSAVKVDPDWRIGFSPREVNCALAELGAFMNAFENRFQDPPRPFVYDNRVSPEEFAREFRDFEDHKIDPPIHYDQIVFTDDGETLLDLLRKATDEGL
jgi:hypothetical protein